MQKGDMVRTIDGKEAPIDEVIPIDAPSPIYEVGSRPYFGWQLTPIEPQEQYFVMVDIDRSQWWGPYTNKATAKEIAHLQGGRYFKWSDGVKG
jgi:nitrous oxide reductase accessory protein NosL